MECDTNKRRKKSEVDTPVQADAKMAHYDACHGGSATPAKDARKVVELGANNGRRLLGGADKGYFGDKEPLDLGDGAIGECNDLDSELAGLFKGRVSVAEASGDQDMSRVEGLEDARFRSVSRGSSYHLYQGRRLPGKSKMWREAVEEFRQEKGPAKSEFKPVRR